jgi:hypothetical protein
LYAGDPAAVAAARRGWFSIIDLPRVHLRPPVRWSEDPYGSVPWRRSLQSFTWLDPLLGSYLEDGDVGALSAAKRLALDWIDSHRSIDYRGHSMAWEGNRSGARIGRFIYVLEATNCAGVLGDHAATRLLAGIRAEGRFCARNSVEPDRSNHATQRDLGLLEAATELPFLGRAARWSALARGRFEQGLAGLIEPSSGLDREHTPLYQVVMTDYLDAYLRLTEPRPELAALLDRMRAAASWLTMPDGELVPLGDTPYHRPAPDYALADDLGLAPTLAAGVGIVKTPGTYFATQAAYFRKAHKTADELTFDLFGHGRRLVVDPGRHPSVDRPRARRRYASRARAHSVLTVDGGGLDRRRPYGSALDAQGEGDGWYAIEGHNPLAHSRGVDHRRLFVYRPGEVLVIVDRLQASRRHRYSRWLQVAPGIWAVRHGDVVDLSAANFTATIWSGPETVRAVLHRGERRPLNGWYVAGGRRQLSPRTAVELRSRGRSSTLVATVAFGARPVRAEATDGGVVVEREGNPAVEVAIERSAGALALEERPVAADPP